jgi:hypothetical protein
MIGRTLWVLYFSWKARHLHDFLRSNILFLCHIVASSCVCHSFWLCKLLEEMIFSQEKAINIRVDNKSAIELTKNSVHHERSKHRREFSLHTRVPEE